VGVSNKEVAVLDEAFREAFCADKPRASPFPLSGKKCKGVEKGEMNDAWRYVTTDLTGTQ